MKHLINSFLILLVLCVQTAAYADITVTYYHTDALGSIVAASDEDGDVLWRKTYDPMAMRSRSIRMVRS